MQLQMLRGFKASVFMSEAGLNICVDTLTRFISTITCLDKIRQLKREARNETEFLNRVNAEIVGSSVVADWGHMRTYIIHNVDFKTDPVRHTFDYNGSQVSVAEYMHEVY